MKDENLTDRERALVIEKAEEMFLLLVRWQAAERVLQSAGASFARKVSAANDLEKAAKEAGALVDAVLSASPRALEITNNRSP